MHGDRPRDAAWRREVLEHLTRELIEIEVMDAPKLQQILDQHRKGPQLKPGTFVERPLVADEIPHVAAPRATDAQA